MTLALAAVVPAAGLSRRMGKEKVLLPFGSSTVLDTVMAKLADAGVGETVIVLRPGLASAVECAGRWHARVVINEHPEGEMLVSIQLGVAALSAGAAAFFIWPADHPAVSPSTLTTLASAADPMRAVIPCHQGRRGHPVLVGANLRAGIEEIPAGEGLRHLWRTHPEAVREIAVEDPGILVDLDTPEDYARWSGRGGEGERG